jgi:hypothetical protein
MALFFCPKFGSGRGRELRTGLTRMSEDHVVEDFAGHAIQDRRDAK